MRAPKYSIALAALIGLFGITNSTLASAAESCREQIEKKAPRYRDAREKIWKEELLFIYADVAKTYSAILDQEPGLRDEIAEYKAGYNPVDEDHLKLKLSKLANRLEGYADSISRSFKKNYAWFKPTIHTKRVGSKHKVYLVLPTTTTGNPIKFELGGDLNKELARLDAGVQKNLQTRIGWVLDKNKRGFSPEFTNEQDYLIQKGVPANCFAANDPASSMATPEVPEAVTDELVEEVSSMGRANGEIVVGFPTSKASRGSAFEMNAMKTYQFTDMYTGAPVTYQVWESSSGSADIGGGMGE